MSDYEYYAGQGKKSTRTHCESCGAPLKKGTERHYCPPCAAGWDELYARHIKSYEDAKAQLEAQGYRYDPLSQTWKAPE
jgi:uncharacterized Zn finger protein (UPF0148 family)